MNYHIMVDDKFLDGFIEDAEMVCKPGTNRYFIRKSRANAVHVKHPKAEWVADMYSREFRALLNSITPDDRIIIHWYDLYVGKLMLSIDANIPLYVALWGGDFYCEPLLYHKDRLFDPLTLQYINQTQLYPAKWSQNPFRRLRQLRQVAIKKRNAKKEFVIKTATIKRINYILIDAGMSAEVELVAELYQITKPALLSFNYNHNFDLASKLTIAENKPTATLNIQIGNSATATNNHLDILRVLQKFGEQDIQLSLPLSYGDKEYAAVIESECNQLFKNKAYCITRFMDRETYVNWLATTDICIMFHNRSQALGNCIALLAMGKKLFFKRINPLWKFFQKIGVTVFDAEQIAEMNFEDFSRPLTPEQVQSNMAILSVVFSTERRRKEVGFLLN